MITSPRCAAHPARDPSLGELLRGIERRVDEPLSAHTSFRIGGPGDLMALPRSVEEVQRVVRAAAVTGYPLTTIGNGSNLLVRDGGLRGIVVKIADNLAEVRFSADGCRAQAGAPLAQVSRAACARGLAGLAFACGIPGTIGGGVMMNAGAYGGELREVVTHVTILDENAEVVVLDTAEMEFEYRTSVLQRRRAWILEVAMDLVQDNPERQLAQVSRNQYLRESRQPLEFPSAGSVFKRPPGRFVGPMVEELGLKGRRVGGAEVSPKHAGFIVNVGGARAADVLELIALVRGRVQDRFGVDLETEIRIIGED